MFANLSHTATEFNATAIAKVLTHLYLTFTTIQKFHKILLVCPKFFIQGPYRLWVVLSGESPPSLTIEKRICHANLEHQVYFWHTLLGWIAYCKRLGFKSFKFQGNNSVSAFHLFLHRSIQLFDDHLIIQHKHSTLI